MKGIGIVAGFALRESVRRRVFVVVALLTVAFLGLYGLGVSGVSSSGSTTTRRSRCIPAGVSASSDASRPTVACNGFVCQPRT